MKQRETECCTPNGQIKRYKDCIGCDKKPLELNQNKMEETLEEAAEKHSELQAGTFTPTHKTTYKHGFEDGAKWQQQRMYSEKEVLALILQFNDDKPGSFDASQWFEQNKKQ